MATFPYAFRKVFIGSGVIRTSGKTIDLKPGEIGLFDAKSFQALAAGATYTSNREAILAQGSYHTVETLALGHGGYRDSIKSRPIQGHFISDFRVAHPKRAQNHIVAIGYDGVSTTKTIKAEADKDYFLRIDLKGEPIYRFLQHHAYNVFHVKAPCADPCSTECSQLVDPNIIADDFVNQINSHYIIGQFVKAEKIVSCDPAIPANPNNVAHNVWNLTICDTGDQQALGVVAGQYPTYQVSRVQRNGSLSVYEICIPTSAGTPTAYDPAANRLVPNCVTCPSGYTLNAKLYKHEVIREDAGNGAALTAINTNYSVTGSIRLSYEYGTSKYVIFTTTPATPTATAGDTVLTTGDYLESVCVENTPAADVAWVDVGDRYKTTRELTLTVAKTCGGANRLTDIRNFYAGVASQLVGGTAGITVQTAGDCADVYVVEQYNKECLLDPCGGLDTPEFDTLQSFEGQVWEQTPVEPLADPAQCLVGIRLTGAYLETKFGYCSFDPNDHYELDAVKIIVDELLEGGDRCVSGWPVTELQQPSYASGVGETVLRELITFLGYKKEDYFCDPRMRETQNLDPVLTAIDRNKFYRIYYITYNVPYLNNKTNMYNNEQFELMVAFPEEANTQAFENLINGYITSVGVQLKAL